MAQKKQLTYEEAIEQLEATVAALEDGEVPLKDLVTKFEEGSKLLKVCQEYLKDAELKIEKLNLETGELENFPEESND
jgi:Exonuclease VII small subunit